MTDQLTRGWTMVFVTGTASGVITIPAQPGIIRVMDSVRLRAVNSSTVANTSTNLNFSTSDGTYTNLLLAVLILSAAASATDLAVEDQQLSSLDLAPVSPGANSTISFNWAPTAPAVQLVVVKGHDI